MGQKRFIIEASDRAWFEKLGWRSVDDVLACSSQDVAALSQSSDVVRVPIDAAIGGPDAIFVKRYLYKRLGQRIKQMFRGTLFGKSRARKEYEFLLEMCRRNVPTVRPIAYGERRRGAFLWASFVITQGIDGFQSLDLFALAHLHHEKLSRSKKQTLIGELGEMIRHMHDAGVRHGGFYWRNILIATSPNDGFDFLLLDPDTHARLFDSPVPQADAIADLSEFVASAMALGMRGGFLRLMKAYFQMDKLGAEQKRFIASVVKQAAELAPAEQRRMAVTEIIEWLRERVASRNQRSDQARNISSLDEFFTLLTQSKANATRKTFGTKLVHFTFAGQSDSPDRIERDILLENGQFSLDAASNRKPDLVVRSDMKTWLAVIAGHPDSFARVKAGKLRVHGDTRLLPALVGPIDE